MGQIGGNDLWLFFCSNKIPKLAPLRVVKSASSIINIILRFLIHAKAPDRKESELTSRVNSSIFSLSPNWV